MMFKISVYTEEYDIAYVQDYTVVPLSLQSDNDKAPGFQQITLGGMDSMRFILPSSFCHGTPCLPRPHAPDHLRPSLTPSAYTPVSLRCTLCKLAQPHHSCCRTKLGSMSNFPGLCPYVLGHHLCVFCSI